MNKGAIDRPPKRRREESASRKPEKRVKCMLMVVDKLGEKRPATVEELNNFEQKYYHVAKFWKDPTPSVVKELEQMSN